MVRNVTLTIDHKSVTVPENTTILEAARSVNINIPTLCYLKDINEIGACRICCVEVEGMERLVPACDNVVADGMVVFTNSAKAREARRMNLRLILSHHDTSCTNCTRSGNCTLQQLANDFNMRGTHFPKKLRHEAVDYSTPLIRENDKCVQCLRCIQVCGKRAEREDLGPSRHGLAHGRRRVVQPPHSGHRVYVLRPVHHPLPDGGAARARRHGSRLRRDRRSEYRHRGAGRARGARGMGRAVRARQRVSQRPSAWSRRCASWASTMCSTPDLPPTSRSWRRAASLSSASPTRTSISGRCSRLLPGLGSLCEVPVPRTDGQSLHGQVAPADVRCGGEELLCRKGRYRPQAPFRRLDHAVRVEKQRMRAADDEKRRGRPPMST